MYFGGPEFVRGIIAIATIGGIMKTWVRAKHGLPTHDYPRGRSGRRGQGGGDPDEVTRL